MSSQFLLKRLEEQYEKHEQLIIAYDFDDTVREWNPDNPYDGIVGKHQYVVDLLNEAKNLINAKFICFTARNTSEMTINYITKFCNENDIPLDAINDNVINWYPQPSKIFYNIFLDDKAGLKEACYILKEFLLRIKNKSRIPDGEYFGIIGGKTVEILNLNGTSYGTRESEICVRGFNIKVIVQIIDNEIVKTSYI